MSPDFDVQRWLAAQQRKGKCACGECHLRAKVAHEHKLLVQQLRKAEESQ